MTKLLEAPEARPQLPQQASSAAEVAIANTVQVEQQDGETMGSPAEFKRFVGQQDFQKSFERQSKTEDQLRFSAAQERVSPYAEHYPTSHQTDRDLDTLAAEPQPGVAEPEIGSQEAFDNFANAKK